MNRCWKLSRLCGIDLYIHGSFPIVPSWVALTEVAAGSTLLSDVSATFSALAVFGCEANRKPVKTADDLVKAMDEKSLNHGVLLLLRSSHGSRFVVVRS